MTVLGVGIDVVDAAAFATQLAEPFSAFADLTFTAREQRAAAAGAGDPALRLAARYAAKEALIKAWSGARAGRPPARATVDLREIEVVADAWGRPALHLHGAVAAAVQELGAAVLVSLAHDGPTATAIVLLQAAR